LANPVLLRQEILGKVREAIGTVEFEIPYIFVLKKDNSKNVYKEAKKHAEQIIIEWARDYLFPIRKTERQSK